MMSTHMVHQYPQDGVEVIEYDRYDQAVQIYNSLSDCASAHGIRVQRLLSLIYWSDSYRGTSFDLLAGSHFRVLRMVDKKKKKESYKLILDNEIKNPKKKC